VSAASRLLGAGAGVALDRLLGEPPVAHPVAAYGRLMAAAEERLWHDSRWWGTAFTAGGIGFGAATGAGLSRGTAGMTAETTGLLAALAVS